MKLEVQTCKQLFSMMLVFGTIASLGMASIPNAFAVPDPSQNFLDGLLVQGETADIVIGQGAGEDLTTSETIRVYETDKTTAQAAGSPGLGNCPNTVGLVDSWQLVRASDDAIIDYKFLGDNDGIFGEVKVKYGTGVGDSMGNTVEVIANSETILSAGGVDELPGVDITAYWKATQGANLINTDNLGSQSFLSCGLESPSTQYIGGDQLEIEKPVGGEILSINTSALVLAGLTTSAVWILPTIGTAIGTGLVLYKLRK